MHFRCMVPHVTRESQDNIDLKLLVRCVALASCESFFNVKQHKKSHTGPMVATPNIAAISPKKRANFAQKWRKRQRPTSE